MKHREDGSGEISYLIVTRAENELGIGVAIQDSLDDFALVDSNGANLEILLADEN